MPRFQGGSLDEVIINDGTNSVAILAATETQDETRTQYLASLGLLYVWDGTNFRRVLGNTSGQISVGSAAGVHALADGFGNNVNALVDVAGAVIEQAVRPYGFAPDGGWDRIRTLGDQAPGLGVMAAAPYTPGSSEVKSKKDDSENQTTPHTIITPASGKKIRIISVASWIANSTANLVQYYFGTGATIDTAADKAVAHFRFDLDGGYNHDYNSWPDGGGPVGAVDEVLSMRTSVAQSGGDTQVVVQYREE